ncbi:MAG: hypothetical protein M3460_09925 [Actinomycetota bacterium]|nr:hypothetical protein [Actinomycetota bacterium]
MGQQRSSPRAKQLGDKRTRVRDDDHFACRRRTVDGPKIRFRHPLVRSAIYQSASLSERLTVHAALGEVLSDQLDRGVSGNVRQRRWDRPRRSPPNSRRQRHVPGTAERPSSRSRRWNGRRNSVNALLTVLGGY